MLEGLRDGKSRLWTGRAPIDERSSFVAAVGANCWHSRWIDLSLFLRHGLRFTASAREPPAECSCGHGEGGGIKGPQRGPATGG